MPDAQREPLPLPDTWVGVLSGEQWRTAARVLGADLLEELRPLLDEVTPAFKTRFVAELARADVGLDPGLCVVVALARSSALGEAYLLGDTSSRQEVSR